MNSDEGLRILTQAAENNTDINSLVEVNGKQYSQLMVACLYENVKYVKDLLQVPGIRIDEQNNDRRGACLHVCL